MKKIIAIVLVALVVITGVMLCVKNNNQHEEDLKSEDVSNLLTQYQARKKSIENQIKDAWEEYDVMLSGGECCFVLFVDDLTDNLMENAYQLIMDYGYKATVIMNDLNIPGEEGNISKSDYNKLLNAGWDFAIGTGTLDLSGDDSVAVLEEYIDNYRAKLKQAGFDMPETFCFGEEQYDEKYTYVLLENDFKVIRHYEVIRDKFSHEIERNGQYLLSTGTIRSNSTTTLKKDMKTVYDNKYTYGISVRCITKTGMEYNKAVDSSTAKYQAMLDYIVSSCVDANVFSAMELYNYKSGAVANSEGYVERFFENMEEMEQELLELDEKIKELKVSLNK